MHILRFTEKKRDTNVEFINLYRVVCMYTKGIQRAMPFNFKIAFQSTFAPLIRHFYDDVDKVM